MKRKYTQRWTALDEPPAGKQLPAGLRLQLPLPPRIPVSYRALRSGGRVADPQPQPADAVVIDESKLQPTVVETVAQIIVGFSLSCFLGCVILVFRLNFTVVQVAPYLSTEYWHPDIACELEEGHVQCHFGWSKIQQLGLASEYKNQQSPIGNWLNHLFGLTFLPPAEVESVLRKIL
nr:unnamed protein product [Callosobruchus analis]